MTDDWAFQAVRRIVFEAISDGIFDAMRAATIIREEHARASQVEAGELAAKAKLMAFAPGYPSYTLLNECAATLTTQAAEIERLRDLAESVLFHQLNCLGGCHESLRSLTALAVAIKYNSYPGQLEELQEDAAKPSVEANTYDCYVEERRDFKARAEAAESALARARKALTWYGAPTTWERNNTGEYKAQWEGGKRARAALTDTKGDDNVG